MGPPSAAFRGDRPVSEWSFPPIASLDIDDDLIAVGADLEPATLLEAYSTGYFPMPVGGRRIGWFSPDPRGILPLDGLRVSRSLRRSIRRYRTTIDQAFDEVIRACGDPRRPNGWIDRSIIQAYTQLHHLGWAHSIEVWEENTLVGGLYGVAVGGLFAGESMFHRRTDASKAALVHLVEQLGPERTETLLDVQWRTPHLASLGVVELSRQGYAARLARAIELPVVPAFAPPDRA